MTTVKHQTKEKRLTKDHGGFQQQSPQRLVNGYEHMNGQNEQRMMRLKAIEAEYYSIENLKKLQRYDVNTLYSAPPQFSKHEWSVAPSIFNIKARGTAHCLYLLKLILNEVYEECFHAI